LGESQGNAFFFECLYHMLLEYTSWTAGRNTCDKYCSV
jgi:hypothetical protein